MIQYIRHLFLPHHTNNFRAKLLHFDFFLLYVVLFFIMSLTFRTGHKIDPNILGYATDIRVERLLELTNQKRGEAGLSSLTLNSQLSEAASGKAANMFGENYWSHNSPSGKTPWDFINGAGYVYTVAGENLAKNFSNSEGVVEAWMNSASHKENIVRSDYQDIGFAVVNGTLNGEETTLVVQMFGKPLTKQIAQAPTTTTTTVIPVEAAQAEENQPPIAAAPVVIPSPEPLPSQILTAFAGAVIKKPLIDITQISKQFLLGLSGLLLIVMTVDGVYIWKRKIVRVGGRNIAHVLFIFLLTGVIWSLSLGAIL